MTLEEIREAYERNAKIDFYNEMVDRWTPRNYEVADECRRERARLEKELEQNFPDKKIKTGWIDNKLKAYYVKGE